MSHPCSFFFCRRPPSEVRIRDVPSLKRGAQNCLFSFSWSYDNIAILVVFFGTKRAIDNSKIFLNYNGFIHSPKNLNVGPAQTPEITLLTFAERVSRGSHGEHQIATVQHCYRL